MSTFLADLTDLMPFTVIRRRVLSRDVYGKPNAFAPDQSIQCRISFKVQRVMDANGEVVIARGAVWLAEKVTDLTADDIIQFPDGSQPSIVSWDIFADETGFIATKIYFG